MSRAPTILAILVFLALPGVVHGHEVRPGYLEISQRGPEIFDVFFKVPARGDLRLALYARMPENCEVQTPLRTRATTGAFVDQWSVTCVSGLVGETVHIEGLSLTLTDVLVRLVAPDGTVQITRLTPDSPAFVVEATPSRLSVIGTYFTLGVEHILLGIDHLLFVLTLLLLVNGWRRVVATITSFTVAHSITLALASLGFVHVAPATGGGRDCSLDRVRGGRDRALPRGSSEPGTKSALDRGVLFWFAPRPWICGSLERGWTPGAEYSPGLVVLQRGSGDRAGPLRSRGSDSHRTCLPAGDSLAILGLADSNLRGGITSGLLDNPAGFELLANMRQWIETRGLCV